MALASWKSFRFFEATSVAVSPNEGPYLDQAKTSCIAAGQNNVFVGSPDGQLRLLNQSFKIVQTFRAHESGSLTHIAPIADSSYLVTLAEDLSNEPELKVWALDKPEKKTGIPTCLCTVSIQNGRRQFPVSAFSVLPDLTQVAVGFANGSVTIVRGDFIHDRGTKQRTVLDADEPITGLEFREGNTSSALFIATTGRILTLVIAGKGQGQPARTLDEHGCAVGCMIRNPESREILIARDDAIYSYNIRGRGASFAYDGSKKLISTVRDYIMFVSPPQSNGLAKTAPLRSFGTTNASELYSTSSFTIIDPDLKIVAHSEALSSQIAYLFVAWQMIFLITQDGKVLRYQEKSFPQKLELLYQRDAYVLAINLAQKDSIGPTQQNIIFRKYGDYLFSRGDYDTAMQQYLRAIDNTEPSQIIRKFLDNQRIRNLIEYLEELHEHGKASPDHTTLLLNCYAKLKDVEKLESFIRQPGELKFDLDTAISMCRQGGYSDQAAFLARKHNEHTLVIDILIEDLKRYAEAMAYILRLEPQIAFEIGSKYSVILLEHTPDEEVQLLIDYYTGVFRTKKDAIVEQEETASAQPGYATRATTAVQNLASLIPLPYMNIDSFRSSTNESGEKTVISPQVVETTIEGEFVAYPVPKPRTAFASFVDHPDLFVKFLEAVIASDQVGEEDRVYLYATLFEMYLAKAKTASSDDADSWKVKARDLVEQKVVPMNPSNVLLLSNLADFKDGTTLVREQQKQYFDIFRSYTSSNDTAGAIKALRRYGPEEPQLYPAALAYFTSSEAHLKEAGSEMDTILTKIDSDGLMAPLQVIQTLSQSEVAKMGLIKIYLSKTIDKERAEIASNKRLVSSYRSDTATKRQEIEDLNTKPASFSATRCSSCSTPLDLPVVHFLCKHSFHQRCLNVAPSLDESDTDDQCPTCATQNTTLKAIRKAQEESAAHSDLFLDALVRSRDKFGTVSEWFGRGVMNAATTVEP